MKIHVGAFGIRSSAECWPGGLQWAPRRRQPSPADSPAPAVSSAGITGTVGVYVTNEVSGDLTVIDQPHSVVATIRWAERVASGHRRTAAVVHRAQWLAIAPPGVDSRNCLPTMADGIGVVDARPRSTRSEGLPIGADIGRS